mmetsp:Transcript_8603/g.11980  ORF Transcript_8603/g.11980 Transcript_8603/m.11980 type:complete len:194 (-) Transcript_8603:350-931(-)
MLLSMSGLFIACGFASLSIRYILYACAVFCEAAGLALIIWFMKDGVSNAINRKTGNSRSNRRSRRSSAETKSRTSRSSQDARIEDSRHPSAKYILKGRIVSNPQLQATTHEQKTAKISFGSLAASSLSTSTMGIPLRSINRPATNSLQSSNSLYRVSATPDDSSDLSLIPRSTSINPNVVDGNPLNSKFNLNL